MVHELFRLGAQVDSLEFEWGTPVEIEAVNERLGQADYRIVAVVHAETSTGVVNPVAGIGNHLKDRATLYLVDGVTSLGGMPVNLDEWGIDAFYSGTQKCLSCPPGLAPTSFSDRAIERLQCRQGKVPNWYLDLLNLAINDNDLGYRKQYLEWRPGMMDEERLDAVRWYRAVLD